MTAAANNTTPFPPPPPASSSVDAATSSDRETPATYARNIIADAMKNVVSVAGLVEVLSIDATDDERAKLRGAIRGLYTNLDGLECLIDEALARPRPRRAKSKPAPVAPVVDLELRKAVSRATEEIEGIVGECREALDFVATTGVYIAGNGDGQYYDASPKLAEDFSRGMAMAAGALVCLLTYLEPVKKHLADKGAAQAPGGVDHEEDALSHAAEE